MRHKLYGFAYLIPLYPISPGDGGHAILSYMLLFLRLGSDRLMFDSTLTGNANFSLTYMEFIITDIFNKNVMMEFNSTRGNWTGFSVYSSDVAKSHNNPVDKALREIQKKKLCFDNLEAIKEMYYVVVCLFVCLLTKGTKLLFSDNMAFTPTIKLKSVKQFGGSHPAVLVCSAFDFYPKQIKMTWLRNQQQVTTGVSSSEVMPDGDWYYQSHSYLEYTPTPGEKIACVVEHITLSKPEYVFWDPSLPVAERNKIVVGLSGLLLGFVAVISGLIYYKKKSAGYITLCNSKDNKGTIMNY
uniref:Ig-like domain-containing protein n=1 Tax=Amphilophus citrinellus TaxID=61819 RepID=A0A3Q0QZ53_AMPCI